MTNYGVFGFEVILWGTAIYCNKNVVPVLRKV